MTAPDFEALYRNHADPWGVETSWYERRKLDVLLAALPRVRYGRAWEPGCGIGVATAALASRVDRLVASDSSTTAVARTRERTAHLPHVEVCESTLPALPTRGKVGLVVAAEFLYYLPDLRAGLESLWSLCAPGAHMVVMHWAHRPHDAFRSGPETHETVRRDARERGAEHLLTHRERDFSLDVYEAAA